MYLLTGVPPSPNRPLDPKAELGTSSFNSVCKHFLTIQMHDDTNPMSGADSQVLDPELLLDGGQSTQSALSKCICKTGAKLASALIPSSTYYSPGFCARLVGTHTHNSDPLLTYQSVPAVDMTRPTHAIPQRERRIREVAHWSTGMPHLPVKVT